MKYLFDADLAFISGILVSKLNMSNATKSIHTAQYETSA